MNSLTAWHIIGSHALQSVSGPEDEVVCLEALAVVAGELRLPQQKAVADLATSIRDVESRRKALRDQLAGQLDLPLEDDGDGHDGQHDGDRRGGDGQ